MSSPTSSQTPLTPKTPASPQNFLSLELIAAYVNAKSVKQHHHFHDALAVERLLWEVLGQIGSALMYVHSCGLIHLDIKPDNILVSSPVPQTNVHTSASFPFAEPPGSSVRFVLADFGHSVTVERCNKDSDVEEGDSTYMAPETMRGGVCTASDIFSFGLTCLEILYACTLPANGPAWQQLRSLDSTKALEAAFGPGPPLLLDLLRHMVDPDPDQRPSAALVVKASLMHVTPPTRELLSMHPRPAQDYGERYECFCNDKAGRHHCASVCAVLSDL